MRFFGGGTKKISQDLIKKYEQLGFTGQAINQAWDLCKGDDKQMIDTLFALNQQNQTLHTTKYKNSFGFKDENEMSRAIELSISEQKAPVHTYEPLNPEQRLRPQGLPVGLKNVGNTCYVNSLFQSYFMSQKFVRAVLNYDPEVVLVDDYMSISMNSAEIRNGGGSRDLRKVRVEASIILIRNLQRLFTKMIISHKKYVDPTDVLTSVVDDLGEKIPVGDQRDITEYHLNFLSRIEEAFYYQEKFHRARHEIMSLTSIQMEDMPTSFNSVSRATTINPFSTEQSVSVPQENSFINNHFFGKMKQFVTYTQDNENVTDNKDLVLGPIILDVASRDLYAGLEKYCTFKVDDYQTPNGEKSKAEGQVWITRLPDLVFVQLNRVEFDRKKGMPVKINDKFNFEKEIFLDRFMIDYMEESIKTNKRIEDLKSDLERKEKALQKLANFYESNIDVIRVLGMTGDFLKTQMDCDLLSQSVGKYDDPIFVGKIDSDARIEIASDVINKYKSHLENNMENLRRDINTIKETISSLWKTSLSRHKYHLVTILVHDGYAGSGHYYSFNRNIHNNKWKRYNDFQVSEENEETVMTEALGGYANSSAYCLVYLSDKVAQEELNSTKIQQKYIVADEDGVDIERQFYRPLVPAHLIPEISTDNMVFHRDVEDFRFTSFLKSTTDLYKFRLDMLSKSLQSRTEKSCPTHLNSFGIFLKYDGQFEGLLKWYVLDTVIQDLQKNYDEKSDIGSFNLRGKDNPPNFIQRLNNSIASLPKAYMLNNIMITNADENRLECKIAEYGAEYPLLIYVKFMLISFLNGKWQDACYAIKFILELEKNQQSYIVKLVKDTTRVMCLKMALLAEFYILTGDLEKGIDIMLYLTALVKGLLRPEEVHFLQTREILHNAIDQSKNDSSEFNFAAFNESVTHFSHTFHVSDQLDNAVMHYSPKDLEKELTIFSENNLYTWKDINDEAASNQINRLVTSFSKSQEVIIFANNSSNFKKLFVKFHNTIHAGKNVLKLEERKKQGFFLLQ